MIRLPQSFTCFYCHNIFTDGRFEIVDDMIDYAACSHCLDIELEKNMANYFKSDHNSYIRAIMSSQINFKYSVEHKKKSKTAMN